MRAGDIIKHIPTGEFFTIVCNDGIEIIPNGELKWLKTSDCELQHECFEEEHIDYLRQWAEDTTGGIRQSRCLTILNECHSYSA